MKYAELTKGRGHQCETHTALPPFLLLPPTISRVSSFPSPAPLPCLAHSSLSSRTLPPRAPLPSTFSPRRHPRRLSAPTDLFVLFGLQALPQALYKALPNAEKPRFKEMCSDYKQGGDVAVVHFPNPPASLLSPPDKFASLPSIPPSPTSSPSPPPDHPKRAPPPPHSSSRAPRSSCGATCPTSSRAWRSSAS